MKFMSKQVVKCFFDWEFTGLHQNTTPISLGIVTDSGRNFYAEFIDYDKSQVNDWIQVNVLEQMELFPFDDRGLTRIDDMDGFPISMKVKGDSDYIKSALNEFLSQYKINQLEFWSDCLSYDWMLFCQLYGGALNIPDYIYYIPFDICTLFKMKGIDPDISRIAFSGVGQTVNLHNALNDAMIIRDCYDRLVEMGGEVNCKQI